MKKRTSKKLPKEIIRAIYDHDFSQVENWSSINGVDCVDNDFRSLLFFAIFSDSFTAVERLISNGAGVNLKDGLGWYPLHYASQRYLPEVVKVLVHAGADLEVKDEYGNTPLWRATFSSDGRGEVIKLLLSKGANPNNQNNFGISPIKLAETIANYDVSQYFSKVY
ncbi:ankyrin repeat domain-containing protein [Pedobacter sp. PWIIR3]